MKDNELIRREYIIAIQEFEIELKRIDEKYNTFAKIEMDYDSVYSMGSTYPAYYYRIIKLEEVIIK